MPCGNEAITLAKNEVICASESKAHLKYYYDVIKIVVLIPKIYLLTDCVKLLHIDKNSQKKGLGKTWSRPCSFA